MSLVSMLFSVLGCGSNVGANSSPTAHVQPQGGPRELVTEAKLEDIQRLISEIVKLESFIASHRVVPRKMYTLPATKALYDQVFQSIKTGADLLHQTQVHEPVEQLSGELKDRYAQAVAAAKQLGKNDQEDFNWLSEHMKKVAQLDFEARRTMTDAAYRARVDSDERKWQQTAMATRQKELEQFEAQKKIFMGELDALASFLDQLMPPYRGVDKTELSPKERNDLYTSTSDFIIKLIENISAEIALQVLQGKADLVEIAEKNINDETKHKAAKLKNEINKLTTRLNMLLTRRNAIKDEAGQQKIAIFKGKN